MPLRPSLLGPRPTSPSLRPSSVVLVALDDASGTPFAAGGPQQNGNAREGGEVSGNSASHQPLSPSSERARQQMERRDALIKEFSAEWLEREEDRPPRHVLLDQQAQVPISLGVHVMSVQVRKAR